MVPSGVHRYNDRARSPVIGDESSKKDEWYQFVTLVFNVGIARQMARPYMLLRVEPIALSRWLESTHFLEEHIDHLPEDLGPGVIITLRNDLGRLGMQVAFRCEPFWDA